MRDEAATVLRLPRALRAALVAVACLVGLGVSAAPDLAEPAAVAARQHACPAGLPAPWRCAVIGVALDHAGRVGGRVRLAAALLHRPGPPRPAVLALAGGPGTAALPGATSFARGLAPLLRDRDLLVVDQRGTGVSDPIACPAIDREQSWSPADVADCARRLGPRRAFYRTADTVADLDAVRAALRIPRLTIYGVSYGTKVAVDYARTYPSLVDGLVLDSPIVEDTDPFYRRSARGAARVLANQCAQGACAPGTDPVADLRALVARMRRGVLPQDRAIAEGPLLHAIVKGGQAVLRALPAALHAAVGGRLAPLAALLPAQIPDARSPGWLQPESSHTVYLVTSCEDADLPWSRQASAAARAAAASSALARTGDAAFAPFDHYVGAQYGEARMCTPWPEAGAQPSVPPPPDVPALLLVGGDDDLAPLEGAREIAAEFPHATLVTILRAGHGVLAAAPAALRAFAAGG